MKCLLIYPVIPETFWSFKHILKFIKKKSAFPPLGLVTIAAMLPESWELKLIDLNVEPLTDEHLDWADMALISAMIVQKESVREVVVRCREKGLITVAGGPYFTSSEDNFDDIDHLILNEAEITLPLFLADLEAGAAKRVYTSMERPDIVKTPKPRWELLDFKNYASMAVQYSRVQL